MRCFYIIPKIGLALLSMNIGIELRERGMKRGRRENETEEEWKRVKKGEGRKKNREHKMKEVPSTI